jgi:sarcosine oxidase subunit beta
VEIVPALGRLRILRTWSGTLDVTPDHLPVLGTPRGAEGYVVAAGFSGHGFCLAPAIGRTVSELVRGTATSVDVTALRPDRFAT